MNKKTLKTGLLVTIISILFAAAAIYFNYISYPRQMSGEMIFANSAEHGLEVNKIVLTDKDFQITLLLENGSWRVKEADYYYANLIFLNQLFQDINTARYYATQPYDLDVIRYFNLESPLDKEAEKTGVQIQVYSIDNTLLDNIIIGDSTKNKLYHAVKRATVEEVLIGDGRFELPTDYASWLQQPLVSYSEDMIEKVRLVRAPDEVQSISRKNRLERFHLPDGLPANMNVFLKEFAFLTAENALSAQNFDDTRYALVREIEVTTFTGLVNHIKLYNDGDNYWINITLSTTRLPTANVNAYIKGNAFLYEDWYFQIPVLTGKMLANFNIG